MPVVKIRTSFRGRKGSSGSIALANTLSDFVVLTEKLVDAIDPEPLGYEEELEVGGGGSVKGPMYKVEVRVKDETGKERSADVKAVLLKGERIPILGIEALEKLGILLDVPGGKFRIE